MNTEALISALLANPIDEFKLDASLSDDDIETLVQRLKDEADRHWYIDPNDSLQYAEKIIAIGYHYENPSHIALGMMSKGDAYVHMGNYQPAWELLIQAGDLFLEIDDEVGWARTCVGRLGICIRVDEFTNAYADAQQALQIFLKHREFDKYARLINNMTYICNHQGNYDQTLEVYENLYNNQKIFDRILPARLRILYNNVGTANYELGELQVARAFYEKELAIDMEQGNMLGVAIDKANIAFVDMSQGRFRTALAGFHDTTHVLADKLPDQYIIFLTGIAECYDHLGRYQDLFDVCKSTIEIARDLNCKQELARLLTFFALALGHFKKYDQAFIALKESTQIYNEIEAYRLRTYTTLLSAEILYLKGDFDTSQEHLDQYFEQMPTGIDLHANDAWLLQARLCMEKQAYFDAIDLAQKVLAQSRYNKLLTVRYDAHHLLGNIFDTIGYSHRAYKHYLAATLVTEKMQDQLTLGLRSNLISDKIHPFSYIISHYLELNETRNAFFHLQRIKTQVWLGFLANLDDIVIESEDAIHDDLSQKVNQLRYRHHWYYQKLNSPEILEASQANSTVRESYLNQMAQIERELTALLEIINLKSSHGITAQALSVDVIYHIQSALEKDEAVIEFYLSKHDCWVFVITATQCFSKPLNIIPNKIEKLVRNYQFNIDCILKTENDSIITRRLTHTSNLISEQLSQGLFGDLTDILSKYQRLYIIPHSVLHFVPFQVLLYNGAYLLESHEIINLPFSGFLFKDRYQYSKRSIVLANDWDGRLQHTSREAQLVTSIIDAQLFDGDQCVRQVVRGANGAILHIATHSEFRLDNPDLSYIYLHDGPLFTTDLLHNSLRFEMVVLSACETGRARVTTGDDLVGVGHAFLYSGTDAVVASLWRIEEGATYELMQSFYSYLIDGKSKSTALRKAQLDYLDNHPNHHPALWGAFQLLGNPDPLREFC